MIFAERRRQDRAELGTETHEIHDYRFGDDHFSLRCVRRRLYIGWDAPTIACLPLDHGTRTRHFCIMNPFRDRQAEMIAEQILEELKAGNTNVLIPYLSERGTDDRDRYLSNESE